MNKQMTVSLRTFSSLNPADRQMILTCMGAEIEKTETSDVVEKQTTEQTPPIQIPSQENDMIRVGSLVKIKDSSRTISTKWKKKTFKVIKRSRVRLWLEIPGSEKPLYPLITDCDLVQ